MTAGIDLLSVDRGSVSAPAGCGKTHLIATTLARHSGSKPILVLTHTNAGVAALKKRLDQFEVPTRNYRLATIDGWAMRLLAAFPERSGHPHGILDLNDSRNDYRKIKSYTLNLLEAKHVQGVIQASYGRLLVDEYQDCMRPQHDIVKALADHFPTCVLGDDLQCIFGWSGQKIEWEEVLAEFPSVGELNTPHRWINAGCDEIGRWLLDIRPLLRANSPIDLAKAPSAIEWVELSGGKGDTEKLLRAARTQPPKPGGSVLILCDGKNKHRQQEVARHTPGAVVVENVDLSDFVDFAESFSFDEPDSVEELIDFAAKVMTGVDKTGFKTRLTSLQLGTATKQASDAELAALRYIDDPCPLTANEVLVELNKQTGVRPHRPAILSACLRTLNSCANADEFKEMAIAVREQQRIVGREIRGRAVGSTLLLKGLEADVSVLLDTDIFGKQDLYVALSRGAQKIIVCSKNQTLRPC